MLGGDWAKVRNSEDQLFFNGMIPSEGLQLILASHVSKEAILLSPTEGFRLMIHSPEKQPDPLKEGFDVNIQSISYIGIRRAVLGRLPPDLGGDCAPELYLEQRFDHEIFSFSQKLKYTKLVCLKMCFLQLIPEESRWGWDDSLLRISSNYTVYNSTSSEHQENPPLPMTYDTIPEQWADFIGMFGGMLGLYTGLSFVSVLEMIEWIFDLFLYGWRRPRNDNMGPKRLVILTWRDNGKLEGKSGKKVLNSTISWGDEFRYTTSTQKETRRAAFDLAFSDRLT
ncbi:unnamed protein product [Darwinula stevensoni]|uniref:Uncharacterized protein n=1 Tax=Darwinula stevensoni TaxID=69355 RepID=A0A7R8XJH2_9CRUS|nr:unnamed protein product [Darwinula stevensoni]CAG0892227.1 unnamed protein product [Darwinula stevensoni]